MGSVGAVSVVVLAPKEDLLQSFYKRWSNLEWLLLVKLSSNLQDYFKYRSKQFNVRKLSQQKSQNSIKRKMHRNKIRVVMLRHSTWKKISSMTLVGSRAPRATLLALNWLLLCQSGFVVSQVGQTYPWTSQSLGSRIQGLHAKSLPIYSSNFQAFVSKYTSRLQKISSTYHSKQQKEVIGYQHPLTKTIQKVKTAQCQCPFRARVHGHQTMKALLHRITSSGTQISWILLWID